MPCGSTTCNSSNNLEAARPSFPDQRWSWTIPLGWLAGIALRWERQYQRRQLLDELDELDDRLLADIGVSRTAVEEVRRSHLYLIAWRDSR
jgi:uncharacterized protein YjiS (DUF1127 family)